MVLIMKEIEKAFERIWDIDHEMGIDLYDRIKAAEDAAWSTIQNLRKENFQLYKALYGVKHPEDV